MAGSLKIGRYCQIGGASVINGHMEIADKVVVTGMGNGYATNHRTWGILFGHSVAALTSV